MYQHMVIDILSLIVIFTFFSLMNIYKELEEDIQGFSTPSHGNLTGWAKQGRTIGP